MTSRKVSSKEMAAATCVAVGIVGLPIASSWLPDLMLGRMPEAAAHGLSLFVCWVAPYFLMEFWARFFHGRKGPDKPFTYAKIIVMGVLLIIVIEVARALI